MKRIRDCTRFTAGVSSAPGKSCESSRTVVQFCLWRAHRQRLRNGRGGGAPAGLAPGLDGLVLSELAPGRPPRAARLHGLQGRGIRPFFTARNRANALGPLDHAGRRRGGRAGCRGTFRLAAGLLDGALLRLHRGAHRQRPSATTYPAAHSMAPNHAQAPPPAGLAAARNKLGLLPDSLPD